MMIYSWWCFLAFFFPFLKLYIYSADWHFCASQIKLVAMPSFPTSKNYISHTSTAYTHSQTNPLSSIILQLQIPTRPEVRWGELWGAQKKVNVLGSGEQVPPGRTLDSQAPSPDGRFGAERSHLSNTGALKISNALKVKLHLKSI